MTSAPSIESRGVLLERLARARAETDKVFKLVKPEALYDRPIPERHRIIFYLGHLEAFDWNLLQPRLPNVKAFDPTLDRLFAFGIDPVDGGLPSDQPGDWPRESRVISITTGSEPAWIKCWLTHGIGAAMKPRRRC